MGKHRSEGRKPRARAAYVATVEGVEGGVPFRAFYKRLDVAKNDARKTGGTLTDLRTLARARWVAGGWKGV